MYIEKDSVTKLLRIRREEEKVLNNLKGIKVPTRTSSNTQNPPIRKMFRGNSMLNKTRRKPKRWN